MTTFPPEVLDLQDTVSVGKKEHCINTHTAIPYYIHVVNQKMMSVIHRFPLYRESQTTTFACILEQNKINIVVGIYILTGGNLSGEPEGVSEYTSVETIASRHGDDQNMLLSSHKATCVDREIQSTTC